MQPPKNELVAQVRNPRSYERTKVPSGTCQSIMYDLVITVNNVSPHIDVSVMTRCILILDVKFHDLHAVNLHSSDS